LVGWCYFDCTPSDGIAPEIIGAGSGICSVISIQIFLQAGMFPRNDVVRLEIAAELIVAGWWGLL